MSRLENTSNHDPAPARIPRPELLRREVIAMLAASGALLLIATFLNAPIAQPIDLNLASVTEPRAPWFFLWVQELLRIGDPFLWGVALPLVLLVMMALIPYGFQRIEETQIGRWFPRSGRTAQIFLAIILAGILALTIYSITRTNLP